MKSAANNFIRIVAWAFVVFGVLFTAMQAWLLGIPLSIFGGLGIWYTESRADSSVSGIQNPLSSGRIECSPFNASTTANDADPRSFYFRSEAEKWYDHRSIDDTFDDR